MTEVKCTYLNQEVDLTAFPQLKEVIKHIVEKLHDSVIGYKVTNDGIYFYQNKPGKMLPCKIYVYVGRTSNMAVSYAKDVEQDIKDKLEEQIRLINLRIDAEEIRSEMNNVMKKYTPNKKLNNFIDTSLKILEHKKSLMLKLMEISNKNIFISYEIGVIILSDENHTVYLQRIPSEVTQSEDDWKISVMTEKGKMSKGYVDYANELLGIIVILGQHVGVRATEEYVASLINSK